MSEPLTERELCAMLSDATIAKNARRVNRWANFYAQNVPILIAEVRRLQQENDRLCVLLYWLNVPPRIWHMCRAWWTAGCGDCSAEVLEAARRRGRALVEKGARL